MKTLTIILLILAFMSAWGQDTEPGDIVFSLIPSGPTLTVVDIVVEGILPLYDEYEKECYADSSLHKEYHWYTSKGYGDPVGYGVKNSYWGHREPTFQGFIKFLRKKANSEKQE